MADLPTMRRVARMITVAALVVAAAVAIGLGAYWISDAGQTDPEAAGDTDTADRVSVIATVEKVDPAQYTATVRIWAVPRGALSSDGGETANRDVRVVVLAANGPALVVTGAGRGYP